MNPLNRFESIVEGLVEGGLASLLKKDLQPVEVAKKLEREMESGQRIGPGGATIVPNFYTVGLHKDDFCEIEPYQKSLEQEFAVFLQQEAHDRGFLLRPRAIVDLVEDDAAGKHRV